MSFSQAQDSLVIRGGTLIDGRGGPPLQDPFILVEQGRVKIVDERRRVSSTVPDGVPVIDASGKTVLPGLWDAHVHLADWMGEMYLAQGVTSIVEASNITDWILAQRDGTAMGQIRGPRMFVCGQPLGGHPIFGADGPFVQFLVLHGVEHARQAAKDLVATGVDAVKVWAFAEPDEMVAIGAEAKQAGLPVMAHLTTSAREAVLAGVGCLAHCTGLPMAAVKDPARSAWMVERERERLLAIATQKPAITAWSLFAMMEEETYDDLIEFFLQHGTYLEPDFVYRWAFSSPEWTAHAEADRQLIEMPELSYLPDYVRHRVNEAWGAARHLGAQQWDELARGCEKFCAFLKRFSDAGGNVLVGSDTSTWPLPGTNVHRELEYLVGAGLSPMQALVAATRKPAEFIGRDKTLGTVEPGKVADMVIVDGDPLADIRATRRIVQVIKDGQVVDRAFHPDYANPIPRPPVGLLHANPVPRVKTVLPRVAEQDGQPMVVTIRGSGFIKQSLAVFDGVRIPTTFVDMETLQVTIPTWLLGRAGTFSIWVTNPRPIRIMDYLHEDERSNPGFFFVRFAGGRQQV